MEIQEPRQAPLAGMASTRTGGLSGILVVRGRGLAWQHVLARAALLPLAPGARVAVLGPGGASSPREDGSTGAWPPGSPDALLEAHVRAAGGQLVQLGATPDEDEELLATVERHTERHGLELLVIAREPRSLRSRLFGSLPEKLARHASVPVLVCRPPARLPYQRILVGTDFSEVSRAALELALRMTPPGSGRLVVFHGYDTSYALTLHQMTDSATRLLQYYQQMRAEAEAAMRAFLAPYRTAAVDLQVLLSPGEPRAPLHRAACEQDAELVVVGRNGAHGAGHVLLGSVAADVLRRQARYDALAVPGPPVH